MGFADDPGLGQAGGFDCHSNETEWPAYASIAPASWLVQHDVDEGRAVLNLSEWQRPQEEATKRPKNCWKVRCRRQRTC